MRGCSVITLSTWKSYIYMFSAGAYSGICLGGLKFFYLSRGAMHPLGPENPLKSIDFTGPGGLTPIAPPRIGPWTFRLTRLFKKVIDLET